MCGPKPPKDNSAEIAAQREAERVAKITEGRSKIDSSFAGFNPDYYKGVEKAYTDNYFPELDRQFQDTTQKLKLRLANSGNLNSGAGAGILGDLTREYGTKRTLIANQALDEVNRMKGQVETARSDLYGLNDTAADPATIAAQSAARVGTLQAPASYSPLVGAFSDFLSSLAIPIAAEQRGYTGTGTGLFAPKASRGSQTVVNR